MKLRKHYWILICECLPKERSSLEGRALVKRRANNVATENHSFKIVPAGQQETDSGRAERREIRTRSSRKS